MEESRHSLLNECLPGSLSLGRTLLLDTPVTGKLLLVLVWAFIQGQALLLLYLLLHAKHSHRPHRSGYEAVLCPRQGHGPLWVLSVWELEEDKIALRESWLSLHKLRPLSFYTWCLLFVNKPVLLLLWAYLTAWNRDCISNPPFF